MFGHTAASIPDASINTDDAFTGMLFGSLQQQQQHQQLFMFQISNPSWGISSKRSSFTFI